MSFIIRLQNLSRTAKSSDIREFFSLLSIPSGAVCIVGGDSADAFIGFETDEDARQAMRRDGSLLNQQRVKLTFSSKKEMQEAMEKAKKMSNLLQGLEKDIRSNPLSSEDVESVRRALASNWPEGADNRQVQQNTAIRGNQGSLNQTSNDNNSWLSQSNDTMDNWKDFLCDALKRIENATDTSQSATDTNQSAIGSLLGPPTKQVPRNYTSIVDPRQQYKQNSNQQSDRNTSFQSSAQQNRPFNVEDTNSQYNNKNQSAVYSQHHDSFSSFRPNEQRQKSNFDLPQTNRNYDQAQQYAVTTESEYEANLRRQQLDAVEALKLPTVQHVHDPEELFVEFSRLPSNLVDVDNFTYFIRPVVPVDVRKAMADDVLMQMIVYCSSKIDANNLLKRDGELGIRVRWSNRSEFNSLPSMSNNSANLNPQVWNVNTTKRPLIHDSVDLYESKRTRNSPPRNQHVRCESWLPTKDVPQSMMSNNMPNSSQSVSRGDDLTSVNSNHSYVLVTNVPFKTSEWDVARYLDEINVRSSKSTHVFEPGNNRSDTWIVECNTDRDTSNLMGTQKLFSNRTLRTQLLTPSAAQKIYTDGYRPHAWKSHSDTMGNNTLQPANFPSAPLTFALKSSRPHTSTGQMRGGFFSAPAYQNSRSCRPDQGGMMTEEPQGRQFSKSYSHGDYDMRSSYDESTAKDSYYRENNATSYSARGRGFNRRGGNPNNRKPMRRPLQNPLFHSNSQAHQPARGRGKPSRGFRGSSRHS
ncbi:hypothetical protein M3Y95_00479400 [Aphelenchoides besseyi]|nr:hypothetical protein M3Y95_00479400 [Aphelenchoides besseyi]